LSVKKSGDMGEIIFWTLIRTFLVIPTNIFLMDIIDFRFWWILLFVSVYGIIIHPTIIQYKLFEQKNKDIISNSLCSSCKHFDETAVICMKYDKHPSLQEIPCNGKDWEYKKYA